VLLYVQENADGKVDEREPVGLRLLWTIKTERERGGVQLDATRVRQEIRVARCWRQSLCLLRNPPNNVSTERTGGKVYFLLKKRRMTARLLSRWQPHRRMQPSCDTERFIAVDCFCISCPRSDPRGVSWATTSAPWASTSAPCRGHINLHPKASN